MVFCVGLTGNIASGKTTVAKIFSNLGIEVIDSDKVSKELTTKSSPALQLIIDHFGDILNDNGDLDRRKLRNIIFSNPDQRVWLEQLLHPLIRQQLEKQITLCKSPYCIIEIPLLINKEHYPYLNKILVVTAPKDIQVTRVMQRDHCAEEDALAILSVQPPIELRLKAADDVIMNDYNMKQLNEEVEKLHLKYLQESQRLI